MKKIKGNICIYITAIVWRNVVLPVNTTSRRCLAFSSREGNNKVDVRVLYLTAMSLLPRVIPASSLKMKIRVAPRYHLMLWSPSHCCNFSTHGSCTSVPSSACFTLFSHGSLLPETTYANAVNYVQLVRSLVRSFVRSFACLFAGLLFAKRIKFRRNDYAPCERDRSPTVYRIGSSPETVIKPSSRTVIREIHASECYSTLGLIPRRYLVYGKIFGSIPICVVDGTHIFANLFLLFMFRSLFIVAFISITNIFVVNYTCS